MHDVTPEKPNSGESSNKGGFGWYKTPEEQSKPLAEPDENTDTASSPTPESDQETLFRAAAIKCAEMEEELSRLMDQTSDKEFRLRKDMDGDMDGIHFFKFSSGSSSIYSTTENIKGVEGGHLKGNAYILYNNGIANFANDLQIHTDKELRISGINTDSSTREDFELYSKKDPRLASNASTIYYFTPNGDFKKVCEIPVGIVSDPPRKLMFNNATIKRYESEMTPGDFELAGQALQMLINRLKPEEQASDTETGSE
jgi:hypothetical protein